MASVIGLALGLHKTPHRVPELVRLLLESFNPHVRYASCMAVGIAMAGTGDSESVALLEPMLTDMTDYVRQGAFIATAMILVQHNEAMSTKVNSARKMFEKVVADKHEDPLARFGAAIALGIIDAGMI